MVKCNSTPTSCSQQLLLLVLLAAARCRCYAPFLFIFKNRVPLFFLSRGAAYDILENEDHRRVYDRFGEHMYLNKHHDIHLSTPSTVAFIMFQFYGIAALLAFVMTGGDEKATGRTYSFVCLLSIFP